ncbi:MAG: CDP-diacylglycerol--glycerol-3-phosphate 3-phosphatidyltransferase [Gammaproteobacteria bacterium RIFCSPLOWO2_02_FULL_42_14]|nr:MAG: CDP-diacylglycerol--glycerol-3-phosphate 3-phosphatidyltransferase [Gammaproteobacteria bacterium RIFCSPHIGHO2_02_FULL_42_43]OGT28613.1 MAG: CDP-diacylglycerol--glycerol-3-phosphate 3-phosphatidyltransferase [Gammaproteobacteria bacterium RIFCSPHIGHO2_01_FULL_42_8]OGT53020.1 MAG: CDP-diacylglycerol--glycerol-3-phosphate 3-phosphatidyltransferase [Gammaproteobacteria bacterium RIFCSPHIGHO2_12_FULL_41_25]OGT61208.1 MAG: CDP-diacylglycerol--glycerol-3-phosphate 3-phosphatidyltransferase [Ga
MNVALLLTWLRILTIPFILLIYLLPFSFSHPLAAILFALSAFTDWLDGYLARSLSQMTEFGAFLDPVADKLLVAISLVMILSSHLIPFLAIPAAVIVGREIAISALREWMSAIGKRAGVVVSWIAKVKTSIQMLALVMLIWYYPGASLWIKWIGLLLLYAAAMLTLWSMYVYLKTAWPDLTSVRRSQ